MKISLVSPFPDITNFGLRTISSVLREAGHETQLICLPDFSGDGTSRHVAMSRDRYPREVVEQFLTIAAGSDLVGITLMTHYFDAARQLTLAVHRELGVPVVWGGFHPSVRPEECARHADYVCVGEGEAFMVALACALERGQTPDQLPGLARMGRNGFLASPPGLLEQDLDRFPAPDWSQQDHWILFEGRIWRATRALLQRCLRNGTVSRQFGRVGYQTMTGRGCPHCCAYCGNSFSRDLYKGQRFVRYRSVEHVISELSEARRNLPLVDMMWFSDDSFFGRTEEDVRNFADAYKRRIGLPFYLLGSPGTITEKKVDALVEAGLHCVQVGIEHGSPRIQALFQRSSMGNERVLETARILARYTDRTAPPQYDVIYDVDWETLDDQLETLRLVARLPKPYRLQIFTLVYYPGTALYALAKHDGFIHDERAEIYDRMFSERHDSYANTLLFLARTGHLPHGLLEILSNGNVASLMTSPALQPFARAARSTTDFFRWIRSHPSLVRARSIGSVTEPYVPIDESDQTNS